MSIPEQAISFLKQLELGWLNQSGNAPGIEIAHLRILSSDCASRQIVQSGLLGLLSLIPTMHTAPASLLPHRSTPERNFLKRIPQCYL